MTYQVLARKWRPGSFKDMAGQGHVLKTLSNALDNQRLHHAYLFTGTRGVGKTTVARILAKCLNCELGISANPCGKCSACTEIAEGRFIDLIEVDAASRTKVEDTRELLDNVQYAPTRARFKIYLIDEVHMLSNHSFNALLKTLEEPPPHVKFLLATTDPQKLPVTVLSRCLQFNLKNLAPEMIAEYLKTLMAAEHIECEENALWQIGIAAAGSMRDALTLLDQAISYCDGKVSSAGVTAMLGTPNQQVIFEILNCLAAKSAKPLMLLSQEVAEHAPDYTHILQALLSTLHRIAVAQLLPDAFDDGFGDREQVLQQAKKFTAEDIQLLYQIALKGRADLPLATEPRAQFEMLLIRMLVFTPSGVPVLPEFPAESTTKTALAKSSPVVNEDQKKKPESKSSSAAPEKVADEHDAQLDSLLEPVQIIKEVKVTSLAMLDANSWLELSSSLDVSGITGNILANCALHGFKDGVLNLILDQQQSALYSAEHGERITQLLKLQFSEIKAVEITVAEPPHETLSARRQRINAEQRAETVRQFEQDPNVKDLLKNFSAAILLDTVAAIKK